MISCPFLLVSMGQQLAEWPKRSKLSVHQHILSYAAGEHPHERNGLFSTTPAADRADLSTTLVADASAALPNDEKLCAPRPTLLRTDEYIRIKAPPIVGLLSLLSPVLVSGEEIQPSRPRHGQPLLLFSFQANMREKARNVKIAFGSFLSAVGLFFFQHSVIAPAQVDTHITPVRWLSPRKNIVVFLVLLFCC